jgi:bla regulator protein BlaR1
MAVQAIFWFHPLTWWIGARLIHERERACDEEVLGRGCQPSLYAESILVICRSYLSSPLACVSGVTGSNLTRRIEAIMRNRNLMGLNLAKKLILAAAGLAVLLIPILIGTLNAPAIRAQDAKPQFEVASLKPNNGCENVPRFGSLSPSPGRLEMPCTTLHGLIQAAYGTFADGVSINSQPVPLEGGPSWMESEHYSLSAKADAPARTEMLAGPMLQAFLEERFRLKTHRETRDRPVYAMTVGKGGLKVQPLAEDACSPVDLAHPPPLSKPGESLPNVCGIMRIETTAKRDVIIDVRGSTMTQLAQRLSGRLDRTVVDNTGTGGKFNFHLEFTPDPNMPAQNLPTGRGADVANPDPGPNLFVALQEQIGLKLSSGKGPVSFLIIDHVEKPSAN